MLTRPGSACRCDGTGIVADDGTVTDMIGWPLPCICTDSVPRHVRALLTAAIHHDGPASPNTPTSRSQHRSVLLG